MINKVILIGNLGADPEVRHMENGNAVANVTLATSETWRDKNTGERQERTEWHRVVFFGKVAEVVGQYLNKGSKIYVEGRLQTRKWEKDGIERYTTEVVVDVGGRMQMLDSRPSGGQEGQGGGQPAQRPQYQNSNQGQAAPAPAQTQEQAPAPQDMAQMDDDIPF